MLQGKHAGGGLVDATDERDRPLQNGFEAFPILEARFRVFMLDDQMRVRHVELQQLARGELMVQPVDGPVLQVGERIVPRGAGQLVLREDGVLLPGIELIGRVR